MLRFVLFFSLLLVSRTASAADLSDIAGRYSYTFYSYTAPTGRVGDWEAFGATGGTLDISADNSMVMTMHMRDGSKQVSRARILEFHLLNNEGYLIVQWPEMAKPVKQQISVSGNSISYLIQFDDPTDVARYGGRDRGVLKRVSKSKRLIRK
jgi:hypothetical protein